MCQHAHDLAREIGCRICPHARTSIRIPRKREGCFPNLFVPRGNQHGRDIRSRYDLIAPDHTACVLHIQDRVRSETRNHGFHLLRLIQFQRRRIIYFGLNVAAPKFLGDRVPECVRRQGTPTRVDRVNDQHPVHATGIRIVGNMGRDRSPGTAGKQNGNAERKRLVRVRCRPVSTRPSPNGRHRHQRIAGGNPASLFHFPPAMAPGNHRDVRLQHRRGRGCRTCRRSPEPGNTAAAERTRRAHQRLTRHVPVEASHNFPLFTTAGLTCNFMVAY